MSETPSVSDSESPLDGPAESTDFEAARALFEELCEVSQSVREERLNALPVQVAQLVTDLLAEDAAPRPELEQPFANALGIRSDVLDGSGLPSMPERIGSYQILEVLGTGGMGVVYRARQAEPERIVALKMPRARALTPERVRRFRLEAKVLARLDHPGIARIFEAGTVDLGSGPEPWFAMELVAGVPMHEYAKTIALSERIELLAKVCDAVQHAHSKGVVHRDLKPGNVLVDDQGQPRVLDFGTARMVGEESELLTSMHTREGALLGTLPYMSPEQLGSDPDAVDTRADVYGLGVLCYQVLAGVVPHDLIGRALHEAARVVAEDEPSTLGTRDPELRGDVETIVGKAMAKDADRRYATADELGGDLRRFLRDEPILARRPTASYQLRKLVRRHRVAAAGIVVALFLLVAGTVTSTALYFEKERERKLTAQALEATEAARVEERAALNEAERAREEKSLALAGAVLAEEQEQLARKRAEEALALREEVLTRLVDVLSAPTPWTQGVDVRMIDVLDSAVERSREAFLNSPDARARLMFAFGSTYAGLEIRERALPLLDEAIRLYEEAGSPQSHVWSARAEAAYSRARLGDPAGAVGIEEAADWYEANQDAPNVPPLEIVRLRARLCETLQLGVRIAEAEAHGQMAVEHAAAIEREWRDTDANPDVSQVRELKLAQYFAWKALGDLFGRQGRWMDSSGALEQALDLAPSTGVPIHEILAGNSLAHAYINLGRAAEAAELMDAALAGLRDIGATSHRFYGIQLSNAAFVRAQLGQSDRALALYEESLAHSRSMQSGVPSSEEAITLGNLGNLLLHLERIDEAVARGRESVAILAQVFGRDSLRYANSLGTLALSLKAAGLYDEAAEAFAEAVAAKRANVPDHPSIGVNLVRRAEALLADGRWEQVLEVARDGRSELERTAKGQTDERLCAEACIALAAACLQDHELAFQKLERFEQLNGVWNSPDADVLEWSRAVRGLVIFAAGGVESGRAEWEKACAALGGSSSHARRLLKGLEKAAELIGIDSER